jgi:hypothetical protein
VRIVANAAVPCDLGLARDGRALGVALRHITLRQGMARRELQAADPQLASGFPAFEPDNGYRWITGDALVPAGLFVGLDAPSLLELGVTETTTYPLLAAA